MALFLRASLRTGRVLYAAALVAALAVSIVTVRPFIRNKGLNCVATNGFALYIRNHMMHVLEEADIEPDPQLRQELLTFVVAGGGFSGVEVIAEMNDFVRRAARQFRNITPHQIKMILLHSGERILDKELPKQLGLYAQDILMRRGVEIRFKTRLRAATPNHAVLASGERIPMRTLVSTVPSSPHPLIEKLPIALDHGKVKVDSHLQVENRDDLWAVGDCALVPNGGGEFCPATAQHAIRQAKTLAHNIVASMRGGDRKTFHFPGLGKMGSLGHRSAVAEIMGIKVSGILAWFMWRTVYFMKLPGLDRKIKLGISWFLELFMPLDLVHLRISHPSGVTHAHFEKDEVVFQQGELGDCLYIVVSGEVDIIRRQEDGTDVVLARLGAGEYFGEMALLHARERTATVRCVQPVDALVVRKGDIDALTMSLKHLRTNFEATATARESATREVLDRPLAAQASVSEDSVNPHTGS